MRIISILNSSKICYIKMNLQFTREKIRRSLNVSIAVTCHLVFLLRPVDKLLGWEHTWHFCGHRIFCQSFFYWPNSSDAYVSIHALTHGCKTTDRLFCRCRQHCSLPSLHSGIEYTVEPCTHGVQFADDRCQVYISLSYIMAEEINME